MLRGKALKVTDGQETRDIWMDEEAEEAEETESWTEGVTVLVFQSDENFPVVPCRGAR